MKNFLILFFALFGFTSYGQVVVGSSGANQHSPLYGSGLVSGGTTGAVDGLGHGAGTTGTVGRYGCRSLPNGGVCGYGVGTSGSTDGLGHGAGTPETVGRYGCRSLPNGGATCGFGVEAFKSPELGDLHYSASVGNEREVRRIIEEYGRTATDKLNYMGQVALHHAKTAPIAGILIQASPNTVHARDSFGRTPLYYARTKEIAVALLAHGAGYNIKDNFGMTPVEHNAIEGRIETANLLHELAINTR